MHKAVADLIRYAATIGFVNEGLDGAGHFRLRHANGETYRVAATPSDYRGEKNSRADMRRIAGVAHDGPNSGRHRKGMTSKRQPARHVSQPEVDRSREADILRRRHRQLCRAIDGLRPDPGARSIVHDAVYDLFEVEAKLKEMGLAVPPRAFRVSPEVTQ